MSSDKKLDLLSGCNVWFGEKGKYYKQISVSDGDTIKYFIIDSNPEFNTMKHLFKIYKSSRSSTAITLYTQDNIKISDYEVKRLYLDDTNLHIVKISLDFFAVSGDNTNKIMHITDLSAALRSEFLKRYPEYITQCCMDKLQLPMSALCTEYDRNKITKRVNCDAHMSQWCANYDSAKEVECACFDSFPPENAIAKKLFDLSTEAKKTGNRFYLPTKCLDGPCSNGNGYKTARMEKQTCPYICLQQQTITNEGDYATIKFDATQDMDCS
jgi:hypothetical protein